MGGVTLGGDGFTVEDQLDLNKKMGEKAMQDAEHKKRFDNVKPFGSGMSGGYQQKPDTESDYQNRLSQYKIAGRGTGFGFQPRPEDLDSANSARDEYLKKRQGNKDGGKIDLKNCKINTAETGKKHKINF